MKQWTILYYANGNNELEPEMWKSFLEFKNTSIPQEMQIVVQIAREPIELTKLIRKDVDYPKFDEKWVGVRRYCIGKQGCELVEQMKNINMADAINLYDFIVWAQKRYTSEKYILILGGHVYQFVGIAPDFTGVKPCILGFPELSDGIQRACEYMQSKIDILFMDTCYVSTFETLCELGKYKNPGVKYLLTYIGTGPIAGFHYTQFIQVIERCIKDKNTQEQMMKDLIDKMYEEGFESPLIAIKIEHGMLELCKQEFSQIAYKYLKHKELYPDIKTPYEVLAVKEKNIAWFKNIIQINVITQLLIVAQTKVEETHLPIHVLYKRIPDKERKELYQRLYFASGNCWMNLICDLENEDKEIETLKKEKYLVMSSKVLQAFITNANPQLTYEQQVEIVSNLKREMGWG